MSSPPPSVLAASGLARRTGYDGIRDQGAPLSRRFAITYDYLCPFARIANEVVVGAIEDGAGWEVEFLPFSLAQTKVDEGAIPVWDLPRGSSGTRGLMAHQWSLAAKQADADVWRAFHVGVYTARFVEALDVDDPQVLRRIAESVGLDADRLSELVDGGDPLSTLAATHQELVKRWSVFGVPTFIAGDEAVFVRLMEQNRADVERVVDMLAWSNLNEFKRTTIPR